MAKKPGRIFRVPKKRLYTRKDYMRGTPGSRIQIYDMGNPAGSANLPIQLSIVAKEPGQIVHYALEAARVASNRTMLKNTPRDAFHIKFRLFPHVVLRENKVASGAGADRVSDGMRRSFGKPVALACNVMKDQKIVSLSTLPGNYAVAKDALRKAKLKFGIPCRISIDRGKEILKL